MLIIKPFIFLPEHKNIQIQSLQGNQCYNIVIIEERMCPKMNSQNIVLYINGLIITMDKERVLSETEQ